MEWGSGATSMLGLDWFPTDEVDIPIGPNKIAAMSMVNTAAQIIQDVTILPAVRAPGDYPATLFCVEVYDDETGAASGFGTATYRPNADVSGTGALAWQEDDGTTTTIFSEIDESTYDATDYIKLPDATGIAVTSVYAGRVDAATSLTGLRPLAVTVTAVVSRTAGYAASFRLGLDLAGTRVFSPYFTPAADQVQTITYTWYYQPVLNRPWRIADITTLLNASDEWLLEATVKGNEARCYQAYVSVPYCTENRIAVGATLNAAFTAPSTGVGASQTTGAPYTYAAASTIALTTPTGGAWTKDAAGRHLWTVRTLSGSNAFALVALKAETEAPSARTFATTVNGTYHYISAMGDSQPRAFVLGVRTTAPAASVDSQPYFGRAQGAGVLQRGVTSNAVQTANAVGQEFSNAAVASYTLVRLLVSAQSLLPTDDTDYSAVTPTADLLVKIKRKSDNVQFGGTATITYATVAAQTPVTGANPGRWRLIDVALPTAAVLAAATQYYFEFTSATSAPGSWLVAKTLALQAPVAFDTSTFGGTTDELLFPSPGTSIVSQDAVAVLATQPTAPANFAAALARQSLPTDGMTAGCHVDHIDYAHLTWTATALGASFDKYQIERTEDNGVTWVQIAEINTEATATFDDYEGKRDATTQYRIRVVRTDLSFSAWSSSGGIDPQSVGCELIFTSNENPAYNCAYQRSGPLVYQFIDAGERVLRRPYGRDRQLAFIPSERRGTTFETILTVYASDTAPAAGSRGLPAFDRLRALSVLDVPYVCVLDPDGNRLFANITVNDGTQDIDQKSLYTASVTVTEVDTEPAVVVA